MRETHKKKKKARWPERDGGDQGILSLGIGQ